ncbi:MAG TPA: ABC transporter ATP-binding protein [Rhizomicrobium sp.]|nr:ABC transporter ATP-binding protein [Rhizomicrobium sp.]
MIVFDNVSAAYGLNGVGARFEAGIVTGIVGPNGAGKTSLFRAALGLLPLAGGAVRIRDRALKDWSREALARTIAYLPQGGEAHWPLPARALVALGRLPHRDRDAKAIDAALERADATAFADRSTSELSAGERARVLFARALATGAPVLLADEPAAYLDPAHQLRLMRLLKEEAARGTAVAVTLHDLSLASRHCDRAIVLHEGRVAASDLSDRTLAQVFGIEALRSEGTVVPWRLI